MDAGWIDVGMLVATFLLALLAGTTATAAYLTYRVNIDPHVIVYSKHDDEHGGFRPSHDDVYLCRAEFRLTR